MATATFRIWRGERGEGQFRDYTTEVADGIARTVVKNLKVMARMGVFFEEEVQRRYPDFSTRTGDWSWEDYLPPMNASLRHLVSAYN